MVEVTQAEFGELVGISQQAVSRLVGDGTLTRHGTALQWLRAYSERLQAVAAARHGEGGTLDLVSERAALARSQRVAQDLRNAATLREYAPVGLLADVLAAMASAMADRFEQLDSELREACPGLPPGAHQVVLRVLASARAEWMRATASLTEQLIEPQDDQDGDIDCGQVAQQQDDAET